MATASRCHSPGHPIKQSTYCGKSTHTHSLWLSLDCPVTAREDQLFLHQGVKFPGSQRHPCYSQRVLVTATLVLLPLSHLVPKLRLANHSPATVSPCSCPSGLAYFPFLTSASVCWLFPVLCPGHSCSTFILLWEAS